MRYLLIVLLLLTCPSPVRAQLRNRINLDRLNRRLGGEVIEYTHNHGDDHRIFSPILGMPRDLYVYVPPGYSPQRAYPLILYFHMAYVDEHYLPGSHHLVELDRRIRRGEMPPVVIAMPDGVLSGENRFREPHSLFVNGVNGLFGDHVMQEVIPFLLRSYSIRPERGAHAILGVSAGGYGAMSLAIQHRDFFGAVATLAGPLNLRYDTEDDRYHENFNPTTYRWAQTYDENEVVGRFYFGLRKVRAKKYIEPVFGSGDAVVGRIIATNPADLIFSTSLQPCELAIYVNYPTHDSYNFDAQDESFAWLAAQRGITVCLDPVPCASHNLAYFRPNHLPAFLWLGQHMLPPAELAPAPPRP